jgi:nucleolar protein 58
MCIFKPLYDEGWSASPGNLRLQEINCVNNAAVAELMRGLRSQLSELIVGLAGSDIVPMSLGLSHSLSRYKLKFSPDKVDTMIVQAIGLLDDLDKELNTYAMRVREWYGWHFPELAKIIQDNVQFAKTVKLMGIRTNAADLDFSGVSILFLTSSVFFWSVQ